MTHTKHTKSLLGDLGVIKSLLRDLGVKPLLLLLMFLPSCREEVAIPRPDTGTVGQPEHTEVAGFFLLNEGNMGSNKATLDYYDYATARYTRNVYPAANPGVPLELGDVGNDLHVYGNRLYAVLNCSNKVEVMRIDRSDTCDYLLPHRIEHERLEPWRDSLFIAPTELQRLKAFDAYKHNFHVADLLPLPHGQKRLNNQDISRILDIQYDAKECADNARREIFRLRSIGIPAALDYVPAYANRNGEHHWFTIVGQDVLEVEFYRKVPKIYRFTYSHQPLPASRKGEHIPPLFLNPFLKDVTDTYIETADPAFDFSRRIPRNARHAYLCVFNSFKWQPVAIAETDGGKAVFANMGKNILYLPVAYQGRKQTRLAHPFILNGEGEVAPLVPDTNRRLSVRLHRKYPTKKDFHWTIKIVPLMSVEASADASFNHPQPLERADSANYYYVEWKNSAPAPLRYWRVSIEKFLGTPDFAELVFYDADGNPLKGKVAAKFAKAFDDDVLTNAAFDKEKEIRVDFGRPVAVSRVVLLPRSDGNGIYPGDEYELFYHDFDGWRSLGRRTATDYFLDYDNLPAGALYWLHNHTRGVEERPFTITDSGDIRFW